MIRVTKKFAREHGWWEECSFEEYVKRAKKALQLGWNPDKENDLKVFEHRIKRKKIIKYIVIITSTIYYSIFWFVLLFLVIGFFMPNPVRFYKKLNGTSGPNSSSNGAFTIDELCIYDILDD